MSGQRDLMKIDRGKLQDFFMLLLLTAAGWFLTWYVFDHLYIFYHAKYTIIDTSTDIARLIIGIILFVSILATSKWQTAKYPYLPTQ